MLLSKWKITNFFIAIIFFSFILTGLLVYKDYGICIDEPAERLTDIVNYRWLNRFLFDRGVFVDVGTEDLENFTDKYYGVAIRFPLILLEDIYQIITHQQLSGRSIYHIRHLYTYFIYILALYFYYRLLLNLFRSRLLGITGVLMIYSFGRFFAHSFYNIKDMIFMSLFTISLFLAGKVISTEYDKKWCILFTIAAAVTVNSRIVGALLPIFILLIPFINLLLHHKKLPLSSMGIICLSYPLWLLIFPASWKDPIRFSLNCVYAFSDFSHIEGANLYGGKLVPNDVAPVDYFLRWIGLTVPLIYLIFIIFGFIVFLFFFIRKDKFILINKSFYLIIISIFSIVILYQMIKRPTVYNGWRHVFFLYPIMIIFSIFGINFIIKKFSPKISKIIITILALAIVNNILMIIKNHPYEYVSYNIIGQSMAKDYDADYWGLSIYQHFLWVANHNSEAKSVTGYLAHRGYIKANYQMLTDQQQNIVRIPSVDTDYLIVWTSMPMDYYWKHSDTGQYYTLDGYEEVYSIYSNGVKLSALYQKID